MPSIACQITDGVAEIVLDAPDRRNAIDLAMNAELVATLDDLETRDDVGAVIVTGAPPAFCAGADLDQLVEAADGDRLRDIYEGFLRVAHTPIPTIAAVNGAAVGAGMNMALACDVILAGRSARFDARFLQIGIHPGGGHTWRLRNLAGLQATRAMVLFGEILSGEQAERHGLAWRCLDDDALLPTAREMAARAAKVPRTLARRTKATIATTGAIDDSDDAVDHELHPQVWSMGQPDFRQLVADLRRRISGGR